MTSKLDITAEEFLEKHKSIAFLTANKFRNITHVNNLFDYEDLLQLAKTGLFKCWLRFDPAKGYQESTLAFRLAELEILRATRDSSAEVGIKFPRDSKLIYSKYFKTLNPEEITDELKAYVKETEGVTDYILECAVGYYTTRTKGIVSFDTSVRNNNGVEGRSTVGDMVEDTNADKPFDEFTTVEMFKATLTEREVIMLDLFMDGHSQLEVSRQLGISQPHVSRLRSKMHLKYLAFTREPQLVGGQCD